ncbi:MAG: multicopper oxidase domain-containing protein, partial [Balneolaceae bacterium]|nr:multicopper oxidase domain-containing protein [Balneolaceae bacterium]
MASFKFDRKTFLKSGLITGATSLLGSIFAHTTFGQEKQDQPKKMPHKSESHGAMSTVGQVDHRRNEFDPHDILTDWDTGKVSTLPSGQTLREYEIVAVDKEIEIAPGVFFPAWTYGGRIPGPSIRCTEGDRVRIKFINAGSHPHTIHFHGIHPASMDGVPATGPGMIKPTESFTYEFDAEPFGC